MKMISLIIPVYKEEKNVPAVHAAIADVWKNIHDYTYELIFINDGSPDNSLKVIEDLVKKDNHVKLVDFSRNFGKEAATSAGLHECTGDAAIMLDADLQHPVELIPEFIKKWESGADVVVGIRTKNKGEGLIKKVGSYVFYKIMTAISDTKIIPRETDFRLIDRQVIDAFKLLSEKERITRGLIDWLGFRRQYIEFAASERHSGEASYTKAKLLKLAVTSFVGLSLFPLKLAGYIGTIITPVAFVMGVFIFVEKYVLGDPLKYAFSGPAILAVIILFLVGIILSCLGLMALYIAVIKTETGNRPLYIIRKER